MSGVTFTGLVNNETLTLGTDYTATAAYSSANAGTSVSATGTVTLGSTTAAKNYNLTSGGFAISGTIDKATTTLSLSAADTVYTGAAYAGTITATSNVTTTPTYTYYTNEKCTAEVSGKPVNAGTYWVKGVIAESTNNTAAEAKASFTIAKAPLTIKANDKTITYGDAPADNGVTYDGFVGGESEPVVATKATYTYDYTQYGDVGTYAVKPTGAVAANYAITYQSGKLTVEKKPVNLTWSDTSSLYYDGAAKDVTAAVTAGNLVNDDVIGVAVVGGKATEIGSYIAKATALTGEKSENYALPANATKEYSIVSALRSVTVSPTTVTAVIDGLTVKLVGYASGDVSVSAENGTIEGDKLTVGGVTYTVDKSGVVSIPAAVDVKTEQTSITKAENIGNDVFSQINDTSKTKSAGLNAAAATKIAAAEKTISESDKSAGAVKVEVQVTLSIQPMTYADGKLKLDVTPEIQYTYVESDGSAVRTAEKETLSNSDIKASVTISVKLPNEFNPNYAKHSLGGGLYEYLPVTITDGVATWQQSSFSEVELISDSRSAAITFQMNDKSIVTKTYTPANVGEALPTDSKSGYALKGWKLENGETVYTGTLTDTMLDSLDGKTLVGVFAKSWDGYSGYSGYTTTTCAVSVDKTANGTVGVSPKNASKGATVTITTTPDKGWTLETLTVLDKDGKEVELDIVKIGEKYTFKMPSGNVTVKATFMEDNTMLNYFVDVNAQDYFYDAVLWAAQERITSGTDALHFSPSDPCTRAQIVTFLWRAAGSPVAKDTNSFTDVPSDAYYAKAVAWAIENGITNGTSDSTFGPDETCTRAQAVTFLARTLGGKAAASAAFSDVPAGSWYAEAVAWAAENGITTGIGGGLFGSGDNCTRAQIVTFLWRAYGK